MTTTAKNEERKKIVKWKYVFISPFHHFFLHIHNSALWNRDTVPDWHVWPRPIEIWRQLRKLSSILHNGITDMQNKPYRQRKGFFTNLCSLQIMTTSKTLNWHLVFHIQVLVNRKEHSNKETDKVYTFFKRSLSDLQVTQFLVLFPKL